MCTQNPNLSSLKESLNEEGIKLLLLFYKRYVDDIKIVAQAKRSDDEKEMMEKIKKN